MVGDKTIYNPDVAFTTRPNHTQKKTENKCLEKHVEKPATSLS
jgi:hypothetical protein